MSEFDYGTGRRKNATARTRLYAGNGAIEVNGRKVEDYFPRKDPSDDHPPASGSHQRSWTSST